MRLAVTLSAVLITAGCANVPHKGPKTGNGLPPHLDASAGQLLRYCQRIRETGDLATAAGLCERAHRVEPNSPAPLMEVASILTEMGELDLAVSAYKTLLHHSPDHVEAHYALGRTYVAQKRYDLALAEFHRVLQDRPDDATLYNAVGVVSDLMGAHGVAQEAFKKGLNRAPSDSRLRNNLGLSLVRSGRYDEGVAMLASLAEEPQADQSTKENLQLALGLAAEARIDAMARAAEREAAEMEAAVRAIADAGERANEPSTAVTAEAAAPLEDAEPTLGRGASAVFNAPLAANPGASAASDATAPTPLADAFAAEPSKEYAALDAGESGYEFYTGLPESAAAVPGGAEENAERPAPVMLGRQTATAGQADTPFEGGSHAIQFASYTRAEDAQRGWERLRAAMPDLLADIKPDVARADLGPSQGGVFYRLRTPPTSHAEARRLCSTLSARGVDCLVVNAEPDAA